MSFGTRLKEERKKTKLTQKELSVILNIHRTSLLSYEKETARPPSSFLEKLAPLGFDVQYLLTGVCCGDAKNTCTREEQELISCFRHADKKAKNMIMAALSIYREEAGND